MVRFVQVDGLVVRADTSDSAGGDGGREYAWRDTLLAVVRHSAAEQIGMHLQEPMGAMPTKSESREIR